MIRFFMLLACMSMLSFTMMAQGGYQLNGNITAEDKSPLTGAVIYLYPIEKASITDVSGKFRIDNLPAGHYKIEVSFIGYETITDSITIDGNQSFTAQMKVSSLSLQEVVVKDNYAEQRKKEESLNIEIVNEDYLKKNLGGSLMNSLERLPGVSTIGIGSGQSKPVIRGLGFNRVVVVENNIKHEAQQWGADHGLEIDQFAVDNIEVIKGPASLMYGSDAIGGIVNIKNNKIPAPNTLQGNLDIIGKSNNGLVGSSLALSGRKNWLHAGLRATLLSYGDYRVPTDTVEIFPDSYSYKVGLHNKRMRNTAGYEHNYHGTIGIVKDNFQSRLQASQNNSKGGFFANAHGLEPQRVDTEAHDKSSRDILTPYYEVSHLKVSNKTQWRKGDLEVEFDGGFQRNFRQEWSQYTSHGYMPPVFPDDMPFPADLEREFKKDYYSANLNIDYAFDDQLSLTSGLNGDYHKNEIDGRGFIIPAYQRSGLGGFLLLKYALSDESHIQAGGRYDYGKISIDQYKDWFLSPVDDADYDYLERASETERNFSNFSWSVGYNYTPSSWIFKLNAGKSFRMPTAQELAANGINYHYFRYEVGDTDLSPETSWQLDAGVEYAEPLFAIGASPFLNYFSNYIYLNPTSEFKEGYQVFYYTQSKVLRYGGEIHAHYKLLNSLTLGLMGEYVYSLQLSGEKEGYTLPFSPPASAILNLKYQKNKLGFAENAYFSIDYRLTAAQNEVVPPENKTPAYTLVNIGLGGDIRLRNQKLRVSMQVQNLFNKAYLNHTSYYRLMSIPEQGRNIVLNVAIPFTTHLKSN
ncbi:MAG: TonB-dependent receptor [Carboxylicivirga sp.]|jgi:iron complex outermembrane receptor protein|nr:TonB-dependent receptor [Carboxylicivirga sp.]